jgi:DNA repair exonuclease SbcCD ATPase subunit
MLFNDDKSTAKHQALLLTVDIETRPHNTKLNLMEQITDRLNQYMQLHANPPAKPPIAKPEETTPLETTSSANSGFRADTVDISVEGKRKAAQELSNDLHKLANDTSGDSSVDKAAEKDPLDQAIEEIEEKIRELAEQMARLQGKNDEASQEQLKNLEVQMLALTTQLLDLNTKKLEQLKK